MLHASRNRLRPGRHGSILIMVLLILAVAVMIASTFIAQMTAYHIGGTRQSARQIAAQTALAGAIYAEQLLIRDFSAARSGGIPQRYNEVAMVTNPRNTKAPPISGGFAPRIYAGAIPANRIGLDWLLPLEGRLHNPETADYVGSGAAAFMARFSFAANRHPNAAGSIEPTRPVALDSLDDQQDIALQYAVWRDSYYQIINNGYTSISGILPFLTPFKSRVNAQPRWLTLGYYDLNFQPLDLADRAIASYEARVTVTPFPLDGCINVNFGDRIMGSTTGGLYRLGYRNPNIPPGTAEIDATTRATAISTAKGIFNADAQEVDEGKKMLLDYDIGDTTSVGISNDLPYQAYQVTDTDKDWIGKSFPLSHQYAASLTNMIGSLMVADGGATVSVRKQSAVTWTVKYTSFAVNAAMVMTGGLYKASSGIGELSMLVNIALGQGYRGNRVGYDTGIPGDPWFGPQVPASLQVGTPASFRQLHAGMGFTSNLDTTVTHNNGVLPISAFALTPFGQGLDMTRRPARNRAGTELADIDCPWYVNALLMSQPATKAMICAMDSTWYRNFDNPWNVSSGINGYPLHKGNLLPIPPPKADPLDPAKIAVWDDGVASTGADGVEGGGIPPIKNDMILSTTYRRPAYHRNDTGFHFEDPFLGDACYVWRNPIRDQAVTRYVPFGALDTTNITGNDDGMISDVGRSNYGHPFDHSTVERVRYSKAEDHISQFAIGGDSGEAAGVENFLGTESEISENKDTVDERLAWQNDIVYALLKTMVDLRSDRSHGKKLRPSAPHGYEIIEDVETVFLAHLGISVRYMPLVSNASTVAATASDYTVYAGAPLPADPTWPLGRLNQLWALSQSSSEIGADRGTNQTSGQPLRLDADGIIMERDPALYPTATATATIAAGKVTAITVTSGGGGYVPATPPTVTITHNNPATDPAPTTTATATATVTGTAVTGITITNPGNGYLVPPTITIGAPPAEFSRTGQTGYRGYNVPVGSTVALTFPVGAPPAFPDFASVKDSSGATVPATKRWPVNYRPTWAALSRVMEHRVNDVRMSLFGTPALDLNGDRIIDATTNDGSGVVMSEAINAPGAQLRFSSTGRWYLGQNRYWRVFIKAELWDRRGDTLADESALEQVIVLDPDGDGDLSDSHTLFSRWHANPVTTGRSGPTTVGRTEATLP